MAEMRLKEATLRYEVALKLTLAASKGRTEHPLALSHLARRLHSPQNNSFDFSVQVRTIHWETLSRSIRLRNP